MNRCVQDLVPFGTANKWSTRKRLHLRILQPGIVTLVIALRLGCAEPIYAEPIHLSGRQSVKHEAYADGSAEFFHVVSAIKQPLWIVECAQPFKQCAGHTPSGTPTLKVMYDANKQPRLIANVHPAARISVQEKNTTQDVPTLFFEPLTSNLILRLSDEQSFVVMEEDAKATRRVKTAGLDLVLSYLQWVADCSDEAALKDKTWSGAKYANTADTETERLQLYQFRHFWRSEHARQTVPSDKPQSEFAIQSQGGHSFFSKTGRSGY